MAEGVIQKRDLTEVLVDTAVMEKAITHPTDSKLYLKGLLGLNQVAWAGGCPHASPGPPYDGRTLMRSLDEATAEHRRENQDRSGAHKGYRGHEAWPGAWIVLPGQRSDTPVSAAGVAPIALLVLAESAAQRKS